jgi:hypothetical protein
MVVGSASAQELPPLADRPQNDTAVTEPTAVLDEPIKHIADTPQGCSVLDKDFPGLRQHSMYPFFKSLSLNQIAAMSKGQITAEMLAQAKADLTALDSTAPAAAGVPPVTIVATP